MTETMVKKSDQMEAITMMELIITDMDQMVVETQQQIITMEDLIEDHQVTLIMITLQLIAMEQAFIMINKDIH